MSDLVSSFTVFRDVLLLLVNIGMLIMLFVIAGQMNGQRQRSKTVPRQVLDLLEKILAAQRKAASALVTTNNEFRNHLKNMVINVDTTEVSDSGAGEKSRAAPLGDFKALRREVEGIDGQINETLSGLQALSRENAELFNQLLATLRGERQAERELVTEFQQTLRADLNSQADRIEHAIEQLPSRLPVATQADGKTVQVNAPSIDLQKPLEKWLNRGQELHAELLQEIRSLGAKLATPTEQFTAAAEQNFAQLRKLLESFMIENARHDKQTEEFQRSLRADLQAQANLIGQAVVETPARSGESPAAVQLNTAALDHSLQEWLGRTRELHESLLQKIQTSPAAAGGNGHSNSAEIAIDALRKSLESHQQSMQALLSDFLNENIRQSRCAEELRDEMREDFRRQTELLSRAVSDIARKLNSAPQSSPTVAAAPVSASADGSFKQWLEQTRQLHQSLVAEIREATRGFHFPTDEFRQITGQHHDSLRKLLEDWTEESIRRVRATDELRAAIQQDLKTQADRLRQLAESRPADSTASIAPTSGTVTTSLTEAETREWRDQVKAELQTIIARLDRMHDRMEEIFQI